MLASLFIGGSYALAAAVQPGPLQAYLLSRVAAVGWRQTLPACLAPVVSDGPIALLAIVVVGRLQPSAQHGLQAAGGVVLLYFAWSAYRQWRRGVVEAAGESTPRTLFGAVLVNVLNPHPYLGWALVLGPAAHAAWQRHPGQAVALVAAFYGTMVMALAGFILMVGVASRFDARHRSVLPVVSVGLLAILGTYLLATAVLELVMP